MQNLLADTETLRSGDVLFAAAGDAGLGMIDVRDVAAVAERALLDSAWDGKTYDLTGPDSISYHEIARSLSSLIGRPIRYVAITPDDLGQNIREMGLDEWSAQGSHDYLEAYANGWGDFTTDAVETIAGRRATPFEQFASEILVPAMA